MSDELDGDGIGGPVMGILTNNAFQISCKPCTRKDNKEEYGKTEKIIMGLLQRLTILKNHNIQNKLHESS